MNNSGTEYVERIRRSPPRKVKFTSSGGRKKKHKKPKRRRKRGST